MWKKTLISVVALFSGTALGAALLRLLAPQKEAALRNHLRESWQATLQDARQAAAERRAEMEREIAQKRAQRLKK